MAYIRFGESRLPELFAEQHYDFVVGRAEYINDVNAKIWEVILESHDLLNQLLTAERIVSKQFAKDEQFAFEYRNQVLSNKESRAYSKAYHELLEVWWREECKRPY